jgi:WD40 repeat protein
VGLRQRVAVWDLQQNTVVHRLPELRGALRDLAVHPDGVQVVTVARGLRAWRIPGLSRPPAPTVAAASPEQPAPDATSPSAQGLRKVLDFQVPEVHAHFIAFSPDDSLVALPTRSLTGIMLCRTSDGEAVRGRPFEGTPGIAIWHVAFSGDGKCLISGDVGGKVTVWDAATGQPGARLEGHAKKIERVSLSHDGSVALSCNSDLSRPEVFVWDVASARRLHELTGHQSGILAALLLPEGKAVTVDKSVAVLWNLETGQPAGSVTLAARTADQLSSATLSRDGMFVLLSRPNSIELWDLAAGKPLYVVPEDALRAHNLRPLALSPDHRLMLCSDGAGGLVVWDLVQNRRKALLERAPAGYGSNAAFSRDGRRIVTAGLKHLTLWELLDSPADRE